MLSCRKIKAAT